MGRPTEFPRLAASLVVVRQALAALPRMRCA
jgi:hypothetical protein